MNKRFAELASHLLKPFGDYAESKGWTRLPPNDCPSELHVFENKKGERFIVTSKCIYVSVTVWGHGAPLVAEFLSLRRNGQS
jgi:hypothetical protein